MFLGMKCSGGRSVPGDEMGVSPTVTRALQNLGRNGPLRAGRLSNGKYFFIKLAQTCDEQMVKISERYLKPLLSNSKLTKFYRLL